MYDRMAEIKARKVEIDNLQQPLYDEDYELSKELRHIKEHLARDMALKCKWSLYYEEGRDRIAIKAVDDDGGKLEDEIWEKLGEANHVSLDIFISDECKVLATLYVDGHEANIEFKTLDAFRELSPQFNIQTTDMEEIIKQFRIKADLLELFL